MRKIAEKDIPEDDRDWIDAEMANEVLERSSDGSEPVPGDQVWEELGLDR